MTYTYVTDCQQIDLDKHAFIEASAGTGKTYTIENLVVRLLMEKPDIELENILLVTFTEKATSELKQRISEKLEEQLASMNPDPVRSKKIKGTLDAFDTASIYTIHGFCQTVLREFAFENGSLFTHDVIDDGPLYETLLKEQMRKTWPASYGDDLSALLNLSGFATKKDQFFSLVTGLARSTRTGDTIVPDTRKMDFKERITRITGTIDRLKSLFDSGFQESFERLNLKKKNKDILRTFIQSLTQGPFDICRWVPVFSSLAPFIDSLSDDLWLKNKKNSEACPTIMDVMDMAGELYGQSQVLSHILTVESIDRLRTEAALVKQQHGWLSYDDMISRVMDALHGENATELLDRLRQKYTVAFVDEFQDTDAAQWKIFSKIFLEPSSETAPNHLYLIGDPKQAIYAFRGADVFVYLDAKNDMVNLAGQGRANLYSLATNWRSQPELITAFNRLFGRKEWFVPEDQAGHNEIGYQDVGCPDEALRPETLMEDHSGRSAFNVVDISRNTLAKHIKSDLATFITHEIEHLITQGSMIIQKKSQPPRTLDYGDICILVRGKNDLTVLEPLLIQRGIPYTYYKKPGLFFSEEALYLSVLFHGILDPADRVAVRKALLTPFFDFHVDVLQDYDSQPAAHPLKQLLFSWQSLARSRSWSRLFQSIMEDSGLMFRQAPAQDWDRKQTNYTQMFEHLELAAYTRNLDFRGLSALLDSYRKERTDISDDADIHQIETDDRKVQVMTMHVSKGLQFPIVFVAGGLAQSNRVPYYVYHRWDGDDSARNIHKMVDLSKQTGKDQHDKEAVDENKRLFYVALTRAQFKVYVPYYTPGKNSRLNGSVPRIVSPSIDAACSRDETIPEVMWLTPDIHDQSINLPSQSPDDGETVHSDGPWTQTLPRMGDFRSRRYRMESFSSLHGRQVHVQDTVFHVAGPKQRDDDEPQVQQPVEVTPQIQKNELPGGADTGSMLHDILENIDFRMVAEHPDSLLQIDETRDIIEKTMARYGMDASYKDHVCSMISSTLTTPVTVDGQAMILGHLKPSHRRHEMEFYFPMPLVSQAPAIPELDMGRGYIRGFIDLIFQVKGRFYIADWKSNRLDEGYDRTSMGKSMADAGYPLQYTIYTVATLRWLKKRLGHRFDPAVHFGGIYYFYLRGMGQGEGQGIYYVSPSELGSLDDLEHDIVRVAGAS